ARSAQFLKAYDHYRNQILPSAGGWLDQTNVFIEAVEVIDRHLST
ncbi:unnamed protein product, partial [marine sediment metagenome]